MRVFVDTEFTHLGRDLELISVGLITECGDALYLERQDYDNSKCSEFVKGVVLPLLQNEPGVVCSAEDCKGRLLEWLRGVSSPVLVVDSEWDLACLRGLFGGMPDVGVELLHFEHGNWERVYKEAYEDYFRVNPGVRHHALHDAKAMRQGWLRMHGYY